MQIKNLLLFTCLLASTLLRANNDPFTLPLPLSLTVDCNEPPPNNFQVMEVGSTWVKLAWQSAGNGLDCRIRTYRASDNFLLNTTIVPPTVNAAQILPLPANTDCYSTINTICSDGSHGANSPPVNFRTLILELVAEGFTPGNQSTCLISKDNQGNFINSQCEFPSDGTYTSFKVSFGADSRQFGVGYTGGTSGTRHRTTLGPAANSGSPKFKIFCESGEGPTCETNNFAIKYNTGIGYKTVATYTLSQATALSILTCSTLIQNVTIDRMDPLEAAPPPTIPVFERERDYHDTQAISYPATASPNPFSQILDVSPNRPSAENIHLQLYNLSGQQVLDQQFSGGQEQYTLSTETLSPGFYMLRIEADGEVQTLKVIKSE